MSKNTKRTLLGFVVAIAALLLIAYLPAETEAMSRAAWQYLGCFVFMLVLIISRAIPRLGGGPVHDGSARCA